MATQIRKQEKAQQPELCFAALKFLVSGQDSCALLRSIAQYFWEIHKKYPRPSFLDQRNKENDIGSASGVCVGQSKINVE